MGVTGDGVVTADVGETPKPSVTTSSEARSCVMVVPSMAPEGSPLGFTWLCLGPAGDLWENSMSLGLSFLFYKLKVIKTYLMGSCEDK